MIMCVQKEMAICYAMPARTVWKVHQINVWNKMADVFCFAHRDGQGDKLRYVFTNIGYLLYIVLYLSVGLFGQVFSKYFPLAFDYLECWNLKLKIGTLLAEYAKWQQRMEK